MRLTKFVSCMCLLALLAVPATAAAGDPNDDAWAARIKQGVAQEEAAGEKKADSADSAAEAAALAERKRLRFSAWAGLGFAYFNRIKGGDLSLKEVKGPELDFGGGMRVGISRYWDFQARAGLGIVPASREASSVYVGGSSYQADTNTSALVFIPNLDATFRVHFAPESPWYVGFGPRVGVLLASATFLTTQRPPEAASSSSTNLATTSQSSTSGLLQIIAELGVTFAERDVIELVFRPMVGFQTANEPRPAIGGMLAGSYVF